MDWFGSTIQQNAFVKNKITHFPTHLLELWECNQCLNVIYRKKSNYSPFNLHHQLKSTFSLENVTIKFTQSSQLKNKTHHFINQIHVYCKNCQQDHLLAQFIPQTDPLKNQLSYKLTPEPKNISKTQIIMGKTNFKKLTATQSSINPQNNHDFTTSIQNKYNQTKNHLQNQIMLWYQSKNFRLYEAFAIHSEKKRRDLDYLKNFILQMNPNLCKKENNSKKILKNRQRVSNSLVTESSTSYGHD